MAEAGRAKINLLPSGVPGLDTLLGGGFVEFSFNLIAGAPGAGKTTAAQQILFRNATEERPGLYFTVLGEPQLKMLRYQQQFSFFDAKKLDRAVRYHNLSDHVLHGDLDTVLTAITEEASAPAPLSWWSTRSAAYSARRAVLRSMKRSCSRSCSTWRSV